MPHLTHPAEPDPTAGRPRPAGSAIAIAIAIAIDTGTAATNVRRHDTSPSSVPVHPRTADNLTPSRLPVAAELVNA
ncbi:hypothetical protein AB0D14_12140 [Streptomyces sp. NPDC048484]|uniref:hypothetical protein n=1 Tax=Streptomyces sp. NPDC048484 TaxID=3155146 RepID=UPI00342BAA06